MIIKIDFGFDMDYIYCPSKINIKKENIARLFSEWIYDKNSNYSFWIYDAYRNIERVDYRGQTIVPG